jgi:hypothetical protein
LATINEDDFEGTHLMVMVTPETADQRRIQVEMYWWHPEDREQNSARCSDLFCDTYDLTQLPDLIEQALDDQVRCTIELFLPRSLMSFNLEFPSERLRSPVVHHRVVRRFAERQAVFSCTNINEKSRELNKAKSYWESKWRVFSGSCHDMHRYHKWIEREELSDTDGLFIELVTEQHLCCTSPSFAPQSVLDEVLSQNLRAGVPVCFWSNQVAIDIKDALDTCITGESASFLKRIRELQVQGLRSKSVPHIGRLLYIVWDDPYRPFPGPQRRHQN